MQTPTREQLQEVAHLAVNLPIHAEARFLAEGAANIVYTLHTTQTKPVCPGTAGDPPRNDGGDMVIDGTCNSKCRLFLDIWARHISQDVVACLGANFLPPHVCKVAVASLVDEAEGT